jgi:amino acid transporter
VAYGPQAIVLVLVAAGTAALRLTLPVTLAIAGLLVVLVISYCQVIAVHPGGGGAYAVGKKDLGATVSLLAAASLVVDYVLTVAVSLAAGAASLASAFPSLGHHLLAMCLLGLILITAVNLWGIAESARVLTLPMVAFLSAIFGVIIVGLMRSHPAAVVGSAQPVHISEALGAIVILKAFAAGCSALTGIEAIANGVPTFREPRARRAQRTELMLGALLGAMLIGLSVLIRREDVAPRGGVTVLAQLTAGSFGTGWAYYAASIAVTLVLALAANTSFGGLPVLMSLLSDDDRLPHLLGLRAERPVHRYGVVALAVLAAVLLIAVSASTDRLIPLYAIGVFIGFTISQTGLVRHWYRHRSPRWTLRAALNGTGAVLTATAAAVFVASKFTSGAWVVVLAVPALMLLFSRIQNYYQAVGLELELGAHPHRPLPAKCLVIVPVGSISKLTQHALHAALSLGDDVIAVSVHPEAGQAPPPRRMGPLEPRRSAGHPQQPAPVTSPPGRRLRPARTARQPAGRRPDPRDPATPMALPHPAESARPAPGDRPARQHRRRHLHHPVQAQHPVTSDLCNVTLPAGSICRPQSLSNACSMTSVSAGWM